MTIFELVGVALEELYKESQKQYGASADDMIREQMSYLSKSYGQLNKAERLPVNYKDPATRFAYVYKYVAAHGDYVVQVMQALRQQYKSRIFNDQTLRVSCVGGGPGSDIIAILKYLDEYKGDEPVVKVICYLLDKEPAWADTWTELDESLNVNIKLNANFQPLDVTNPDSWRSQRNFLKADLFTLSYFVSEVYSLDKDGVVREFWRSLFNEAKPGALFLYDDNGHSDFNDYFDRQWKEAGLECLVTADNARITPRYSEQASELEAYTKKFGQNPKIQAYLSFRVLRKPSP